MSTDADRLHEAMCAVNAGQAALNGRIELHKAATMQRGDNDQAVQLARQDVLHAAEELLAAQERLQRLAQAAMRKTFGA